jgi:CelD/BcsL family acetyltransferase involved in cellulose biosynthesis
MAQLTLTKFSLYDPNQANMWDAFVSSHPHATPFHLTCWLKTILETYSFQPELYVAMLNDKTITGIFPCFLATTFLLRRRLLSIPFSDYGGPLFSKQSDENAFVNAVLNDTHRKLQYIQVRGYLPPDSPFRLNAYYKRHILDLTPGMNCLKSVVDKRTIQYSIRKAEKAGVAIREENNQMGIEQFYYLNTLTRKKHGVPHQPPDFFSNLLQHVISKRHGFILLAEYQGNTIGASIYLTMNKCIHYKYNASQPIITPKISPNHLLTWHAIKKGCKEGYRSIDFGRTSPENEGLMRYKRMWGTQESTVPYYYYPETPRGGPHLESSSSYKILTRLWRSLPQWVVERLSPLLFKHIA